MMEQKETKITEETLDQELELLMESMPEQEDFEKKIDRYIKKKIRNITIKTVCSMFIIIAVLFLMISPAMDQAYLNPKKLEKDGTFQAVLRDYYEITRPYIEMGTIHIEKKGFARYSLGLEVHDYMEKINVGLENVWVDVVLGKYKNWNDPQRLLLTRMGAFEYPSSKEDIDNLTKELEKLPESAKISLAISEKEVRDVEELRKEKVDLDWLEVYHPNQPEFQGGLSLWRVQFFDDSDDRENMTEEELLKVYVQNLKNLAEHPDIWRSLGLPYHTSFWPEGVEQMKDCYEDAKTLEKLQTKAYYISGRRDEILEYLRKTSIESVSVYDVKSNIWE